MSGQGLHENRLPDNPPERRRKRLRCKAIGRWQPARDGKRLEGQVFGMLMLTALLALLLLNTLAWALHDSRTVVERHKEFPFQ